MTPPEFSAATTPVVATTHAAEATALSAADPVWDLCPDDLLALRTVSHRDFESRPPAVVAFVFAFYAVVTGSFVACTAFLWHFTRESVGFSLSAVVLVLVTAGLGIHVFRMLWLEVSTLLERTRARRKLASLTRDCRAPVLRRDLAPDDQIIFDGLAARVCRHHRHGEEAARRKALADLFTFAVASTTHGEALTAGTLEPRSP